MAKRRLGGEDFISIRVPDQTLSVDSRYLYARNSNQNTFSVFRVENDRTLSRIQDVSPGLSSCGTPGIAAE